METWQEFIDEVSIQFRLVLDNKKASLDSGYQSIEKYYGKIDSEIASFLENSLSEADADFDSFRALVEFLEGKPSRSQMVEFMSCPL